MYNAIVNSWAGMSFTEELVLRTMVELDGVKSVDIKNFSVKLIHSLKLCLFMQAFSYF